MGDFQTFMPGTELFQLNSCSVDNRAIRYHKVEPFALRKNALRKGPLYVAVRDVNCFLLCNLIPLKIR